MSYIIEITSSIQIFVYYITDLSPLKSIIFIVQVLTATPETFSHNLSEDKPKRCCVENEMRCVKNL